MQKQITIFKTDIKHPEKTQKKAGNLRSIISIQISRPVFI